MQLRTDQHLQPLSFRSSGFPPCSTNPGVNRRQFHRTRQLRLTAVQRRGPFGRLLIQIRTCLLDHLIQLLPNRFKTAWYQGSAL